MAIVQQITLVKGGHRWTFACSPDETGLLIEAIEDLASRKGVSLDRADVALVRRELDNGLKPGLQKFEERLEG